VLEVESARHTIHIHQLTCQMQARTTSALHRGQIDLTQIDTSSSHEFFPERTATLHGIPTELQLIEQSLFHPRWTVRPTLIRSSANLMQHRQPQPSRQMISEWS
tara:strand:- start:27 stop:338 length:312 start_codon:yes stop_codon:yes gene_type:complete